MVDFTEKVMKKMTVGDKIQIWAYGVGLALLDIPEVAAFNMDPSFLKKWGVEARGGRVAAKVTRVIPAAIMASGLGGKTSLLASTIFKQFTMQRSKSAGSA